jgi:hypothetical protein
MVYTNDNTTLTHISQNERTTSYHPKSITFSLAMAIRFGSGWVGIFTARPFIQFIISFRFGLGSSIEGLDSVHRVKLRRWMLVRSTPAIRPREVLSKKARAMSPNCQKKLQNKRDATRAYLAIVAGKVQVVQCVVCWTIDNVDECVASDHVRVMDLETGVALASTGELR